MDISLPENFAYVTAMIFVGAFVQGATGFGFSLLVVPVAAALLGLRTAVPMMNLLSVLLTTQILYTNRRGIVWSEAFRLMLAALPGLALGLAFLRTGDPDSVKRLLGLLLFTYGLYAFVREWRTNGASVTMERPARPWLNALAGFSSGFFGGACATDGPPVVVYGNLQGWPQERFRSILQAFFVFTGLSLTIVNLAKGYLTPEVLKLVVVTAPVMYAASLLGNLASGRLDPRRFRLAVLTLVVLMGANLLLR